MVLEISQYVLPIQWTIGDVQCKGLTLTQIGALPDGIYELVKLRRWSKSRISWLSKVLDEALTQAHLTARVQDAQLKLDRDGARRGKANYQRRAAENEMSERQREYGMLP